MPKIDQITEFPVTNFANHFSDIKHQYPFISKILHFKISDGEIAEDKINIQKSASDSNFKKQGKISFTIIHLYILYTCIYKQNKYMFMIQTFNIHI